MRVRGPCHYSWLAMRRYCGLVRGATPYQRSLYEGVTVCREWWNYAAFEKWAMDNGWFKGAHLTRLDKKGDFCPGNCVWCTPAAANGKRSCVRRLPDGRSARDLLGDERLGLDRDRQMRVASRLFSANWSVDKALASPRLRRPHVGEEMHDGLYNTWRHIRRFCVTKGGMSPAELARYEGVGMCAEWRDNYEAFARWCRGSGWRSGMAVVRRDKRGDFAPENCVVVRWVRNNVKGEPT